jgi:hypothetical protein
MNDSQCKKMTDRGKRRCKNPAWADTGYCERHQLTGNRLTTPPKIRPLDPGKPLAPYRVPELKAFDRCLPGQGQFDFSSDDPDAIVYPEDENQTA